MQKIAVIVGMVFTITSGLWWSFNNVIFAEQYNSDKQRMELRWAMYEEWKTYTESRDIRALPVKTASDIRRLADLEHMLKLQRQRISALRNNQ